MVFRSIFQNLKFVAAALALLVAISNAPIAAAQFPDQVKMATDFDGDGAGDLMVFDPTLAKFFIRLTSSSSIITISVGVPGDVPVVGDFNGDDHADLGTFNRSSALWTVRITGGTTRRFTLGNRGDMPVPADYRGDGCTQPATYNPRGGTWTIGGCNTEPVSRINFGGNVNGESRVAVPADYDCDGKADLAVFLRYRGRWVVKTSSDNEELWFKFGRSGDVPVPGNYLGAGCVEPAVYRPTNNQFYVAESFTNGQSSPLGAIVKLGSYGDRPVIANTDTNALTNYVVFRPSTRSFYISGQSQPIVINGARPASIDNLPTHPLPVSPSYVLNYYTQGDYNRDGRADFVTAERGDTTTQFKVHFSSSPGNERVETVAAKGDAYVPGDYNGDGVTQPAVVTVIDADTLRWTIKNPNSVDTVVEWGRNGDRPMTGDFDCDGKTDLVLVRRTDGQYLYWHIKYSSGISSTQGQLFGLDSDTPYVADPDGDGCSEFVTSRVVGSYIYWYYFGYGEGGVIKEVKWGTSATDTPMSPMDIDGDGADDLLIERLVNGQRIAYGRLARPEYYSLTRYPWMSIPFGLEGDILLSGHFNGAGRSDLAVYRSTGTPGFFWHKLRVQTYFFEAGNSSDSVIRPDGTSAEMGSGGSTRGCTPTAGTPGDFNDGRGGAVWKPVSEGINHPRPTAILPSSYANRISSMAIYDNSGNDLGADFRLRYIYHDGRPLYDLRSHTASELAPAPITVKVVLTSGATECRVIEDPNSRQD